MNITITGRHVEVTPALKKYATDKMERMDKYSSRIIDANIILTVEKYRHIAEITVLVGGTRINGKEATEDMYSSIDKVLEKVERQLRRHKEKQTDHSLRIYEQEKLKGVVQKERGVNFSEMLSFPNQLMKSERYVATPMSAEEAATHLEMEDAEEYLAFNNSNTKELNIICRCNDGSFELIEP